MESTESLSLDAASVLGGRYRLGPLIARGATAEVFRARDDVLGRDVAVKVFRPEALAEFDVTRQRAEVKILASLNHPALVTVFDAGAEDPVHAAPRTYVVMELIEGITLGQATARGPLAAQDVAAIGAQLAAGLDYIHSRGIVHRDVKPANIMLVAHHGGPRYPATKLTDFGIARHVDSTRMTSVGLTIGTANYLSPEQATGGDISGASDLYSLGLVLLEALTGNRAFPGHGVEAALLRLHADPVIPARLGPEWALLLASLTARNPSGRPSAAQAHAALKSLTPHQVDDAVADDDTDRLGPLAGITWDLPPAHAAETPHRWSSALKILTVGAAVAAFALLATAFAHPGTPTVSAPPSTSGFTSSSPTGPTTAPTIAPAAALDTTGTPAPPPATALSTANALAPSGAPTVTVTHPGNSSKPKASKTKGKH